MNNVLLRQFSAFTFQQQLEIVSQKTSKQWVALNISAKRKEAFSLLLPYCKEESVAQRRGFSVYEYLAIRSSIAQIGRYDGPRNPSICLSRQIYWDPLL